MKVLVTGANGFLGLHIIKKLIERKFEVRAFVLKGTSLECFNDLSLEIYEGDLLNIGDIRKAIDSCDYLIHTAAKTDVWPSRSELTWKVNYGVVKNLIEVVKEKKIKRYIHIGTANSFGFGDLENPGSEESQFTGAKYKLDYIDSKNAAQELLLESFNKDKIPVVIINPTFMIGEYDSKPGPGELIIPVIKGKNIFYTSGGRCFACVKDVATACVNALEKGKIGECYITGGKNLSYKEFFSMIASLSNVKVPIIKIPKPIAVLVGFLLEIFSKIFNNKVKLTIAIARISADKHFYTSNKAINELDYPQTELEIALNEAINWYKNNGYVNKKKNVRKRDG